MNETPKAIEALPELLRNIGLEIEAVLIECTDPHGRGMDAVSLRTLSRVHAEIFALAAAQYARENQS